MSYSIGFDIFAKDAASAVFKKLGDHVEQSEGKFSKFKASAVAGAAVAVAAVGGFAKSSVDKFKEVGGEVLTMQRVMGGTPEQMSKLRFAAEESGVGVETLTKSSGKLAKTLAAAAPSIKTVSVRVKENQDGLTVLADTYTKTSKNVAVHTQRLREVKDGVQTLTTRVREGDGIWKTTNQSVSKASDKYVTLKKSVSVMNPLLKEIGINVRDSHGKMLPMDDILLKLSDKFKAMPGGAGKTALAMKLFGKSGTDMLPFLNKGSEGIKELQGETGKYGLVLSGKMLQSLKDSKKNQREWNATLDGLKVQIGAQVLPVMTKFVQMIRDKIIPLILSATAFFSKHQDIVKKLAIAFGIIVASMKLYSAVTKAATLVMKLFTAGQIVAQTAMKLLKGEQLAMNAAMKANMIGLIVVGIALLAGGLIYAYKHCQTFRDIVNGALHLVAGALDFVKDHWKLLITLIMGPFGAAIVGVVDHWTTVRRVSLEVIGAIVKVFLGMVSAVIHGAASAFGWVPGLGGKLKSAAKAFDTFKNDVNRALDNTQKSLDIQAHVSGAQAVISSLSSTANLLDYIRNNSHVDIGVSGRGTAGLATGGTMFDGLTMVGEEGPELMRKDGSNVTVLSHPQTRNVFGRGGHDDSASGQPLIVQLTLDGSVIHQALLKVKRGKGGLALGLA